MTSDYQKFLAVALRRPAVIGAVAPSSTGLSELLAAVTPTAGAPVVVELGPGTGSVSAAIQRRLPAGGRHIAVEIDPAMVRHLSQRHPRLEVVHGDAADLADLVLRPDRFTGSRRPSFPLDARPKDAGTTSTSPFRPHAQRKPGHADNRQTYPAAALGVRADAVVSGLPWSLFRPERQLRILSEVAAILQPDGAFTTFAYRHAGAMAGARSFQRLLNSTFDEVIASHTVWRNMPPARIYACRRPLTVQPLGRFPAEAGSVRGY